MRVLMLGSGSYKSPLSLHRPVAFAKELGNRGYDVRVVLPRADKYNNFIPDKTARIEGVTLVQPWQPATKNDLLNLPFYMVTATIASLRARPQLIYLSKPTPITIIGLIPKLLFRAPLVLDLDDLGSEVMRLQHQPKLQVKFVALCERLAMRYANAVVVASTYLETEVKKAYPDKPVLVLSNGVDPGGQKPLKNAKPRNMIYYYGVINRLSLIETLLRSLPATFEQVPDAKAMILGDGSALIEAKELVKKLGISNRVAFKGWTLAEDLDRSVRLGDVAVCTQPDIPTVRAASNMKVFQYMRLSSVPVVSDVGDLASYVKEGQGSEQIGVVVPPNDSEALSRALVRTLLDKSSRLRMAKKARTAAEQDYAISTLTHRLDQFLQTKVVPPRIKVQVGGRA